MISASASPAARAAGARRAHLALALLLGVSAAACWSRPVEADGTCSMALATGVECAIGADGGAYSTAPLVGYTCTGTARPDQAPLYTDHIPQGLVCAEGEPIGDAGAQGYCCTPQVTDCALDPVLSCGETGHGFQCRGGNRPESLNPRLSCSQGVRQGDFVNYCCYSEPQPPGCQQSDSVACSPRLIGWSCTDRNLPKGEELGANKSRADFFYLLCPTPTPAANPRINTYCCYSPALVPIGGSCVQHTAVPGCSPGRFGFACYGRDTPDQDYPPMHCADPGVPGISMEGYRATLFCCDFQ
jgi:hypothetical protein